MSTPVCQHAGMAARERYHHGDLRRALVEAAVATARADGEAAVGLNRTAAAVGVSASAAYRHFPGGLEDLLVAVGDVAREELAERIRAGVESVAGSRDPAVLARRRFRASGQAYVDYVLDEPGLFQVACRHDRGDGRSAPFALLEERVDDLVTTGVLPASRRRHAALASWAAVHGVALLLTEGPLRRLPPEARDAVVARTLDTVGRGL